MKRLPAGTLATVLAAAMLVPALALGGFALVMRLEGAPLSLRLSVLLALLAAFGFVAWSWGLRAERRDQLASPESKVEIEATAVLPWIIRGLRRFSRITPSESRGRDEIRRLGRGGTMSVTSWL